MKGHNIKELLMPNRDTVKYIAVIAMVIDHIAYMFMPSLYYDAVRWESNRACHGIFYS